MKMRRILALVVFLLAVQAVSAWAEVIDSCAAVVNEDVIAVSEVEEAGKAIFQKIEAEAPSAQRAEARRQAKKMVVERLIEQRLLLQQAKQLNLSVADAEIDQAKEQVLQRNGIGAKEFQAELDKVGLTEQQYRDNLKEQILGSKVMNYAVRTRIAVPDEKIKDYYEHQYTGAAKAGGGYSLLQIGIALNGKDMPSDLAAAKKAAKKKAENVHQLAAEGQDFRELARQHSDLPSAADGGDIGSLQKDEMAAWMQPAVTALKPGGISPVIETPEGYMIIKLLAAGSKEKKDKPSYESVKEEIRDILFKQEAEQRYKSWMEELRSEAYIKIMQN